MLTPEITINPRFEVAIDKEIRSRSCLAIQKLFSTWLHIRRRQTKTFFQTKHQHWTELKINETNADCWELSSLIDVTDSKIEQLVGILSKEEGELKNATEIRRNDAKDSLF